MDEEEIAYHEVYAYTMGRPGFILQHVVDAYAVQTATEATRAIGVVFGLVGLYLHVELHASGRQVQIAHQKLAATRKDGWPKVVLPRDRGRIRVADVLMAPAGEDRDRAIAAWCGSVWAAFGENRPMIVSLVGTIAIG